MQLLAPYGLLRLAKERLQAVLLRCEGKLVGWQAADAAVEMCYGRGAPAPTRWRPMRARTAAEKLAESPLSAACGS